jgi:uncharacterized protein
MRSNRDIVAAAFAEWMNGTGYIASIFADAMTWEIVGRSAVSARYPNTRAFVDDVLQPFSARFSRESPFRPTEIRAITYVWIMKLEGGKVVDGTAFYDSIAFNELWENVRPQSKS